ncbi:MAG TPA: GNAT family N-acetyltransferase [Solirubrobacteraceae bacterium]|nr:GNAT family N-acetyltransferase [Solirubrobacteraceae bacterium]
MAFEFRLGRPDESPGAELIHELNQLLDSQYPGRVQKPGSVTTPDEMVAPRGAFLVGYEGERAVAIGGLRRLEQGVCEIKRLYVVPAARSRGAGRALLRALEDSARELGYERARLDAGPAQVHSRMLFEQTGYVEIAKYNANHIAVYFAEKRLVGAAGGAHAAPAAGAAGATGAASSSRGRRREMTFETPSSPIETP